ncbi:PTS transporter subunit EIIC [Lactobacillus sp. ESL0791]|uniref:PTS transporter subunit EIIC n=1 Tax=Lactobacillus sp. ESL0791 TaxID=2983234 RepID=UPI0023F9CD34|nr:PTS transporter subunit EIIC [Lactobacillus sp. ESL0791]MDF7639361.1 PTS transporter subunit EIIC [Lactobacillus sp. ESL0791]
MNKYDSDAKKIIASVGGSQNIDDVFHCMTRVRFNLRDQSLVNEQAISDLPIVKGIAKSGEQFQIVIGGEVDNICTAIKNNLNKNDLNSEKITNSSKVTKAKNKDRWYKRLLDILSGTMIPLIGVIIGAGMVLAIITLLETFGIVSKTSGTYQFFYALGNVALYFMPVFVGYTSAKQFHADPFMGLLLGAALIYPDITKLIMSHAGLSIFGIKIAAFSYSGTVLPVILATWFMSYVERFAKKICPKIIASFGVPLIIILITVPVTYLVIGPIGGVLTSVINVSVVWLSKHAGFLAIGLIAALMPFLVMSGLHMSLIPIGLAILASSGYDPIVTPAFMVYNMAMAGACLSQAIFSHDSGKKQLGYSSCVSALLGITEPGLFGVVVPAKTPLIATSVSCAIAGIIAGFIKYLVYVPMSQSLLSIPAAMNTTNAIKAVAVIIISFTISFVVNYFFSRNSKDRK